VLQLSTSSLCSSCLLVASALDDVNFVVTGSGVQIRTRRYLNQMGPLKCSTSLEDTRRCQAEVADCSQVNPNWSRQYSVWDYFLNILLGG